MANNRPSLPACVTSGKMVSYGTGKAPTLNYRVPQKTSFTTYGDISLNLPADWFTVNAKTVPAEVTQYGTMTVTEIAAMLKSKNAFPTRNKPLVLKDLTSVDKSSVITAVSTANTEVPTDGVLSLLATVPIPTEPSTTTLSAQDAYIHKVAQLLKEGNSMQVVDTFGNFDTEVIVTERPAFPDARLFIIEEYKTASFLGDYGAGETVKTFSLLPGEKTTITVKTFKEKTSTQNRAENLMDSFAENSAKDFEKTLQDERQTQNQNTNTKGSSIGGNVGFSLGPFSAGGSASKNSSASSVRAANTNSLSKSLEKHTDSTNASRQMSVNTTTNDSFKESTEESTVRELVNPNVSRVLNFVFRQLLQEYISVTYLSDIKVAFTNGHPESFVVLPIEELDEMLDKFIVDSKKSLVRDKIRNEYGVIESLSSPTVTFLETKIKKNFLGVDIPFMTKKKDLTDSYKKPNMDGDLMLYPVHGVVLRADINTLRTDSFVVDALLGQGEALDCFNSHVQEAKMQTLYIENAQKQLEHNRLQTEISKIGRENKLVAERMAFENQRLQIAIQTLQGLQNNPAAFAEAYGKMFNPQQNVINT
jgi:hypothetical protein